MLDSYSSLQNGCLQPVKSDFFVDKVVEKLVIKVRSREASSKLPNQEIDSEFILNNLYHHYCYHHFYFT